ncbi:MAG: DUF1992 domain-containing protein [Desulfobacteraceae bacterium]|nr:DUF1992 domain-containing protein [Desulfobacteraceae bacterium]
MTDILQLIAERRISEAIQEGKLRFLECWKGKPLPQEDDSRIPPDLRMAYKVLKNAGYLPPEIETRKEIQQVEELIAATDDEHVRVKQLKKLNALVFKLNNMRKRPLNIEAQDDYYRKIVERISIRSGGKDAGEEEE